MVTADSDLPADAEVRDESPVESPPDVFDSNKPIVPPVRDFPEMFPGAGKKANFALMEEINPEYSMPDDLRMLFEQVKLNDKVYRTVLRKFPEGDDGSSSASAHYIMGWKNAFPSEEWVTVNYGPGRYVLQFSWKQQDLDGRQHGKLMEYNLEISDDSRERYEEYQEAARLKRLERKHQKMAQFIDRKRLEMPVSDLEKQDPKRAGLEYVQEMMTVARMMGLQAPNAVVPAQPQSSWLKDLLPALLPTAMTLIAGMSEKANARMDNMLQLLITTMNAGNQNLLAMMKSNTGPNTGMEIFKQVKDMVMGAVDLKGALEGNKETVVDKIFNMVETVAPQILTLVSMKKEAREQNIMYKMGQQVMAVDPNLQQLKDPEILEACIAKWDASFGWEQTDLILSMAGLRRLPNCPRLANQKYPQGDARNSAEAVQQSTTLTPASASAAEATDERNPAPNPEVQPHDDAALPMGNNPDAEFTEETT